jgi:hypothetical protein
MTRGVNINDEQVKHYYDLGLPDKEIAAKLDCYKKSVARWRTTRGLPSNSKHGRPRKDGTAMRSNISPRSYGTKLLESKSNLTTVESPVTSRVCDVEHYEKCISSKRKMSTVND